MNGEVGGFRLGMIQMRVEGGSAGANLARAEAWMRKAVQGGAEVVLLPEALNLGWTHPSSKSEAEIIGEGPSSRMLAALARELGVMVCAGIIERDGEHVYNSAVLIDETGGIILRHRKINELTFGLDFYTPGGGLATAPTRHGRAGLMVCADAFAPDRILTRSLAHMGADFILSPCAWAVPADHDNTREPYGALWRECYQSVAREYKVCIAGVSNVGVINGGPWEGRHCIGCSLAVDAEGGIAAQGSYGVAAEEIIMVDVRPVRRPAAGNGWRGENE